ncbi:hypothetical protein ACWGRS_07595 [Cellulosimicrobium funkei]
MIGLLNRGRGSFVREVIRGSQTKYPRLSPLRAGDLVFSKLFAWEGSVTIAERDGWVSSEFPTYQIDESQIDPGYLRHTVRWDGFVDQLARSTNGLGQRRQRVAPERFEAARVPLPDLHTQRAIAARLDRVDRASRQVEAHGGLAASAGGRVLAAALDGAPPARIGSFLTRRTESVEVVDDARYAMLGMRNRGRGAFDAGTLSGSETKYPRLSRVRAGDLIYLKLGAWEGAFGIVPGELDGRHTSPEFITYEIDSGKVDRDFLEALVTWESFAERVGGVSKGTNLRRRRLNPETFEGLTTPLPSIEVQREAGRRLAVLRRVGRLEARRRTLADGLLPAARNEEFARLLAA